MRRTITRSAIDWAALGSKLTTDSAKAEVSRLRAAAGEIMSLSNTYATPPPPIDFAAYKSKISAADVVDKFQAEYARINYPTYVVEEVAEIKAKHDALIAEAMGSVSDSKARIEVLNSLISSMEANKVGPYTTLEHIYELYPELEAEIEAEIENHEWGKDIA